MYNNLHFYIDFDVYCYIDNQENYLNDLMLLLDFVYMHKITVYYSKNQLEDFISFLDEENTFNISIKDKIQIIIENALATKEQNYLFRVNYSYDKTYIEHVSQLGITPNNYITILSVYSVFSNHYFLHVKNNDDIKLMNIIKLGSRRDVIKYINDIHPRCFNKSPKHGENGIGNWKNESRLLCSKKNAQYLLNSSIADFNKNNTRLFNFDNDKDCYMEFFYEGNNPSNQWHGFHLEGQDDNRVPHKVKKHLRTLDTKGI